MKKRIAFLATFALAGGATAAVLTTSGSAVAPTAKRVATPLPPDVRDTLVQQSREVGNIDVTAAQAYRLAATEATIWVAQGEDGSACVADRGGATCSAADGLSDHGITAMRLPAPSKEYVRAALDVQRSQLSATASVNALRDKTKDLPLVHGPASFAGWVPESLHVTSARLLGAGGEVIAQSDLNDGVYDLYVADLAKTKPHEIQLERDGQESIRIGPVPSEVR